MRKLGNIGDVERKALEARLVQNIPMYQQMIRDRYTPKSQAKPVIPQAKPVKPMGGKAVFASALKRLGRAGKSVARSVGKHHKKDVAIGSAIGAGLGAAAGAASQSKEDREEGKSRWGRAAAGAGAGALAGAAAGAARTPLRQLLRMKKFKHKEPEVKPEAKASYAEKSRAALEAKRMQGEAKTQAHNKAVVRHGKPGGVAFVSKEVGVPKKEKPKKKRVKYR